MEAPSAPVDPPALPVRPPPPQRRVRWSRFVAQRVVELCTVFAGVYAAFMLNAHQLHRQETQRRGQLLNWLESVYRQKEKDTREEVTFLQKQSDDFNHQLDAGKMPRLFAFGWSSDYNPSDMTGILQSGGYDLLDFETVRAIKNEDNILRAMVTLLQHDQRLSDDLVLPNLGKDKEVFYDPTTGQLRESYQWYQKFFGQELSQYVRLQKAIAEVLRCLTAERERNH